MDPKIKTLQARCSAGRSWSWVDPEQRASGVNIFCCIGVSGAWCCAHMTCYEHSKINGVIIVLKAGETPNGG